MQTTEYQIYNMVGMYHMLTYIFGHTMALLDLLWQVAILVNLLYYLDMPFSTAI